MCLRVHVCVPSQKVFLDRAGLQASHTPTWLDNGPRGRRRVTPPSAVCESVASPTLWAIQPWGCSQANGWKVVYSWFYAHIFIRSEAKCCFMCLQAICVYVPIHCLFISFAHSSVGFLVFLIDLHCSLHIKEICPLIYIVKVFPKLPSSFDIFAFLKFSFKSQFAHIPCYG